MTPTDLIILSLAIWYSAYVVVKLSGPFNVFGRIRAAVDHTKETAGSAGEFINCIYCTSWWIAVVWLLVWHTPAQPLVYPFALAGAALMLHRYTGGMHT